MENSHARFDFLSGKIGRLFISWSYLEASVNVVVRDMINIHYDPSMEIDMPRYFSKKTEFIRRFFETHPGWDFMNDTVRDITLKIDNLADARNAFAHGTIGNLEEVINGNDEIIVHNERKKGGKNKLYTYQLSLDQIHELSESLFTCAIFIGRLGEILRNEITGDNNFEDLVSKITRQRW